MSALLRFPTQPATERKIALVEDLRPDPVLTTFDREDSRALLGVAQGVWKGLASVQDLIDSDRSLARRVGIETIAIELLAERTRIEGILSALEDAERTQKNAELSFEGLELLRRAEKLLTEASSNISRFTGPMPESPSMGDAAGFPSHPNSVLVGSLIFFGVAITITLIAVIATKD
jgi:hypothetical protein